MEIAFGIICVILFLVLVLGPTLRRWLAPYLQRWMLGKMEDNMRRMAGMPTRKEEKKARKAAERRGAGRSASRAAESFRRAAAGSRAYGRRNARRARSTVGMLRYIAEDVEFTEIKDYSGDSPLWQKTEVRYRVEEQVEDADFTEIK